MTKFNNLEEMNTFLKNTSSQNSIKKEYKI